MFFTKCGERLERCPSVISCYNVGEEGSRQPCAMSEGILVYASMGVNKRHCESEAVDIYVVLCRLHECHKGVDSKTNAQPHHLKNLLSRPFLGARLVIP